MLKIISILTSLSLGVFYPLCFLIHAKSPLKQGFHRFHLGMPLVLGGVTSAILLAGDISFFTKGVLILWLLTLAFVTLFYWKKEYPRAFVAAIPSFFGLFAFVSTELEFFNSFHSREL